MTKQNEQKKMKKQEKVSKTVETIEESNTIKSIVELIAIIAFIIIVLVFFPNTPIWNIVILILILSVLIFVHELGHFITAKKFGVHVYEFALGMGPKVLGFKRKDDPTDYSLRALPIGGYCQMAGEEGEDDEKLPKDKFMCNKSKMQRAIILIAGVTMNFITAIVLLFVISLIWGSTEQQSVIGLVSEDSPASNAGIVSGDRVVECNGYKIATWDKLTIVTNLKNKNDYFEYVIEHKDGKRETYKLVPDTYAIIGEETIKITEENTLEKIAEEHSIKKEEIETSKMIGIGQENTRKTGFANALSYAGTKFISIVSTMFLTLGCLFTGKLSLSALSGPVGMYTVVGTVATYGIANIIYLMAYLSVNLGVLNILPFPAFDGGRVLFILVEAITRKKIDARIEGIIHTIGFILIMLLMLYITFQDILRLF